MTHDFEGTWLSDDALSTIHDEQLFGRTHLADRIFEVLRRVSEQSKSSIIGLVGSWGSGKSSILSGMAHRLEEKDAVTHDALGREWLVTEFNPWLYAGPAEMHAGFFDSLHRAFPSTPLWEPRRENLMKLGRRLAPIAGFARIIGVDGEGIARTLLDDAKEDPVAQRDRVQRELGEADQPVLVIIDDIDRLSAEELLHLFKLVRLVGRLPNVYYLLSYDERTVVDLLAKTDLVSAKDERRGLDYLEKIVQVRIDVPALRPFEVDQVFTRAMAHFQSRHGLTIPRRELELLSRAFDGVLSSRLHTPRAIKRVFGQVDAFYGALGDEVNFADFFIVTWLRTVEPGVYTLVQRHRRELLGQQMLSLRDLEAPTSLAEKRRRAWLDMLADAHVHDTDREDILYVLSTLFPAFGPTFRDESDKEQRSGHLPAPERGPSPTPTTSTVTSRSVCPTTMSRMLQQQEPLTRSLQEVLKATRRPRYSTCSPLNPSWWCGRSPRSQNGTAYARRRSWNGLGSGGATSMNVRSLGDDSRAWPSRRCFEWRMRMHSLHAGLWPRTPRAFCSYRRSLTDSALRRQGVRR